MEPLLACQNPDGGWPYQQGEPSWTEPTAYALMALMAKSGADEGVGKGLRWLNATQRPDGGWPPQPAVRESSWLTSVVVLVGAGALGRDAFGRGVQWIVRQAGAETGFFNRLRQFLTGDTQGSHGQDGWPWFPGTSAWVTPTALSILALRKAARYAAFPGLRTRLDMGKAYLLAHACSDGGWNHGAARTLDRDARSYPETTGVALLALAGDRSAEVRRACIWARKQLPGCGASEAESWLRLGLLAQGQLPPDVPPPARPARTIQNAALARLAAAASRGPNPFLE